jgi:hypothetical protein
MMRKSTSGSAKRSAQKSHLEEKGDVSERCLKRTIALCAVGLVGVLLFWFSPKKSVVTKAPAAPQAEGKSPVTSFDRQSISSKNR